MNIDSKYALEHVGQGLVRACFGADKSSLRLSRRRGLLGGGGGCVGNDRCGLRDSGCVAS